MTSTTKIVFNSDEYPHQRFNPLKGEWVLVSPHRMKRPWSGQQEPDEVITTPRYDPKNPLCPNGKRPNNITNPDYKDVFVFDNDFPALFDYDSNEALEKVEVCNEDENDDISKELFQLQPVKGSCKVMCFHPFSDMTLATMEISDICKVIRNLYYLILNQLCVQLFQELKGNRQMDPTFK
jgi:UDPglucose--hexose-1-phosphate uridylyltransferase